MTCLRLPTSLEDADAIVATCSGHGDWRPLFLLGLGTVVVAVVVFVGVLLLARALR